MKYAYQILLNLQASTCIQWLSPEFLKAMHDEINRLGNKLIDKGEL